MMVWIGRLALVAQIAVGPTLWAYNNSLVQVRSFKQAVDELSPWSRLPIADSYDIGIPLKGGHILISARAVLDAQYLQVESLSSSEVYEATVSRVDFNAQLALLKTTRPIPGLRPLSLGSDLRKGTDVEILSLRQKSIMSIKSRFRDLKVRSSLTANYNLPYYAFDVESSAVGWSEPVIKDNKLVGLVARKESKQVLALPSSVIQRFLQWKSPGSSFGRLGIRYSRLTSKYLRQQLGLSINQGGVWVSFVSQTSPYYPHLKAGDVILAVQNYPVDAMGMVEDKLWGKISMSAMTYRNPSGTKVSLKVWRNKAIKVIEVAMEPHQEQNEYIPYLADTNRQYLIYGGLVFQELTSNYLQSWGKLWMRKAPLSFLYRWAFHNDFPDEKVRGRMIFVSKILADDINKGYEHIANEEVRLVNQQHVHGIQHLAKVLESPEPVGAGLYTRVKLGPSLDELVLDHGAIAPAHGRMAKMYSIPEAAFWSVKQP